MVDQELLQVDQEPLHQKIHRTLETAERKQKGRPRTTTWSIKSNDMVDQAVDQESRMVDQELQPVDQEPLHSLPSFSLVL